MATKKRQRIGIWIIAIAMIAGTLGSFLVMALAPKNQAADQARFEELSTQYGEEYSVYQEKVSARDEKLAAELSDKYYDQFKQYESRVGSFKADDVTELKTEDLKKGDGEALTSESTFTAYYIGWNPEGKVFDGSLDGDSLKMPFEAAPGMVIEGWTEGVEGMKVGGVRELTIPSDMAYGEEGQGEMIPGDTPLKFVMMVIPTPDKGEDIPEPEMSAEFRDLYRRLYNVNI